MANIKKNFNFRNGVQVDDDNLLVTSTGLVGIGTTIPRLQWKKLSQTRDMKLWK